MQRFPALNAKAEKYEQSWNLGVIPGAKPPDFPPKLRGREYLTSTEVERLMKAARSGRHGHRDATLILIGYRHGLRASEIADLEWSQVEFGRSPTLHVRRAKNGSAHPLRGDEVRVLRELRRQFPDSSFVFATERGGPFTPDAVNRLIKRIGTRASPFSSTRTCCGTPAATPWPTRATTRGDPGLARSPHDPAHYTLRTN